MAGCDTLTATPSVRLYCDSVHASRVRVASPWLDERLSSHHGFDFSRAVALVSPTTMATLREVGWNHSSRQPGPQPNLAHYL